jgi:succinate-semialdehyde dehydrogenase / glutarate-semialdehyde dehydrogenase
VTPALPEIVAAVAEAQPAVAALTLDQRLQRVADSRRRLADREDEIVERAVAEVGQAVRFARREMRSALLFLDALPALAEAIRPRDVPAEGGTTVLEWAPYGVVMGWHAANSPIWVPTVVVVSALVGGNGVISRPSRRTRDCTGRVLDALIGPWPEGCVQIVEGSPQDAEALIAAPGVDAVVAHAGTETCKRHLALLGAAYARGARLRPYIPEASGNDAVLVLDGADLDRAAHAVAIAGFLNAGQLCMSAKRIIVERSVWYEYRPLLSRAVERLVMGAPGHEATDVAPLADGPARDHARQALAEAVAVGGEVIVGRGEEGPFFTPTVVLLPAQSLDTMLWREEVFAPLRALVLADDADHAVALANDSAFGLGASVFGGPPDIPDRLRGARISVEEDPLYQDPHLVVGGVGDSGMGGARPKLEQLVYARRVHRAAGQGRGLTE